MNADTLVAVHCYQGDAGLVRAFLPQVLHHDCPVLVLSPSDSPVEIDHEGVTCRSGGKRGYFGPDSQERQLIHMRMLLETQYEHFLLNDSDSFCLSPELPTYLYEQADNTIWANVVRETRPHRSPYVKEALHPPYFLNRATMERLLEAAPRFQPHPETPFIDYLMLALACEAGVIHRSFPDGRSFPAWRHGAIAETKELGHDYVHTETPTGIDGGRRMTQQVLSAGVVFVHSVKFPAVRDQLVEAFGRRRRRSVRPRPVPRSQPPQITAPAEPRPVGELSVLVAFRDVDGSRTRLWDFVRGRVERLLPEAELVIGTDDGTDPFHKTLALNRAAARATGSVFYILDTDSWVSEDCVRAASALVASGAAFVKPWRIKSKLGAEATDRILSLGADWNGTLGVDDRKHLEHRGGFPPAPPLLVAREAFESVGGMDERFRGWGSEDVAFWTALGALYGAAPRVKGECVHLHHTRIGRSGRDLWPGQDDYQSHQPLLMEYRRAARSATSMRALIEARVDDVPDERASGRARAAVP